MIDGGTEVSTVHHRDIHGYYLALQNYFSNTQTKHDRSNSPRAQKARAKLLKLSASQFYELSTDVYDELQRRINEDETQPEYLLPRATFHMKRNQARQKLANLSHTRFNDLVDDILFEIKRRGYNSESSSAVRSSTITNKKASNSHTKSTSNAAPAADGSNSQIPPTATIQTSKVIPQKASIDWSSEEEEQDMKKNGDKAHVNTNSVSNTPDTDKHDSEFKDKSKHSSTLHQPSTTPNLAQADNYYQYGGIIDSPGTNGVGNQQKGNENPTVKPSNRDSNTFDFEGMVKDDSIEPPFTKSSSDPQRDQIDQLCVEIATLKKENESLRQSRNLRGISPNKNFEEDLNSLSVEVGTLSVENEELKAKISELEFKLKNSEARDQSSSHPFFVNGTDELEGLVLDRESVTRFAAEDGSIPFESVEEFHQYTQKLFTDLQTEIDDIGHTLFEDLARLSHTLAQILIFVDLPEYKEEIILLKASLSHTITSIRYFAVFGALLPKITVQAAISELAFAFCNLVRSCKIKGDGRGGAALGPYKLALNVEKAPLNPQTPKDPNISNAKFGSNFNRPIVTTQLNNDESGQDEMSPVKPLKLTQKAGMSPNLNVPSPGRKPSGGLVIGPMIETKSPALYEKNAPTGFQLNENSTIPKPEDVDESLLERIKGSQSKDTVNRSDPNRTLNDSIADKSASSSRATTAEGNTTLSSPPSTASSNDHIKPRDIPGMKHDDDYAIDARDSRSLSNDLADSYHSSGSIKSNKGTDVTDRSPGDHRNKGEQQLPSTSTPKQEAFRFKDLNHIETPQSSANVLDSPKGTVDTPEAIKDTRSKLEGKWLPGSNEQTRPKKNSNKESTVNMDSKSKDHERGGKTREHGQPSQSLEDKSKKNTGKSFTEKLKNFATNAGIGLKVEKEPKEKHVGSSGSNGFMNKMNGIGGRKKSTSSGPNSSESEAAAKASRKNSGGTGRVTNNLTKTLSTASKKSSVVESTESSTAEKRVGKDGRKSSGSGNKDDRATSLTKLNNNGRKKSPKIRNIEGFTGERKLASLEKDGRKSSGGMNRENKTVSRSTLNTNEEKESDIIEYTEISTGKEMPLGKDSEKSTDGISKESNNVSFPGRATDAVDGPLTVGNIESSTEGGIQTQPEKDGGKSIGETIKDGNSGSFPKLDNDGEKDSHTAENIDALTGDEMLTHLEKNDKISAGGINKDSNSDSLPKLEADSETDPLVMGDIESSTRDGGLMPLERDSKKSIGDMNKNNSSRSFAKLDTDGANDPLAVGNIEGSTENGTLMPHQKYGNESVGGVNMDNNDGSFPKINTCGENAPLVENVNVSTRCGIPMPLERDSEKSIGGINLGYDNSPFPKLDDEKSIGGINLGNDNSSFSKLDGANEPLVVGNVNVSTGSGIPMPVKRDGEKSIGGINIGSDNSSVQKLDTDGANDPLVVGNVNVSTGSGISMPLEKDGEKSIGGTNLGNDNSPFPKLDDEKSVGGINLGNDNSPFPKLDDEKSIGGVNLGNDNSSFSKLDGKNDPLVENVNVSTGSGIPMPVGKDSEKSIGGINMGSDNGSFPKLDGAKDPLVVGNVNVSTGSEIPIPLKRDGETSIGDMNMDSGNSSFQKLDNDGAYDPFTVGNKGASISDRTITLENDGNRLAGNINKDDDSCLPQVNTNEENSSLTVGNMNVSTENGISMPLERDSEKAIGSITVNNDNSSLPKLENDEESDRIAVGNMNTSVGNGTPLARDNEKSNDGINVGDSSSSLPQLDNDRANDPVVVGSMNASIGSGAPLQRNSEKSSGDSNMSSNSSSLQQLDNSRATNPLVVGNTNVPTGSETPLQRDSEKSSGGSNMGGNSSSLPQLDNSGANEPLVVGNMNVPTEDGELMSLAKDNDNTSFPKPDDGINDPLAVGNMDVTADGDKGIGSLNKNSNGECFPKLDASEEKKYSQAGNTGSFAEEGETLSFEKDEGNLNSGMNGDNNTNSLPRLDTDKKESSHTIGSAKTPTGDGTLKQLEKDGKKSADVNTDNDIGSPSQLNVNAEKGGTSICSNDTSKVGLESATSLDSGVVGQDEKAPSKLPNFYFNNIPEPPPTSSSLTNKMKESFADLSSEDENEGASSNNSPYMSDNGSVFHSFKQSFKEESGSTRTASPLVQQQNFYDNSEHKEVPVGLGLSKETNMKFDNEAGGFLSKARSISKSSPPGDGQDHYSQPLLNNSNELQSKRSDAFDDSLNNPGDAVEEEKMQSDLNVSPTSVHNTEKERQSKADSFNGIMDGKSQRNENSEHAADKTIESSFGSGRSTQSSSKNGDMDRPGINSIEPSPATRKTSQSSDDLNSEPSFADTRNLKNRSIGGGDNAPLPKLQPVKLYSSNNSTARSSDESPNNKNESTKRENSIKIPKTPIMKNSSFKRQNTRSPSTRTPSGRSRTPSGKSRTPSGKTSSSARSPAIRSPAVKSPAVKSPGGRSLASNRTDDGESFDVDAFDIENPDNTLSELLLYLEHQSLQVISTIQSLLTSIKEPHATKGNLRKESNAINQVIRQMVDATSVSMNQSRNASLKEHGSWVVKSLEDCYLRVTTLCHLNRNGELTDSPGDENHADKHFKQRLAGIAFDIAKCTKELVKTVEEASLKEEIEFLNARLN